MLHQKSPGAPHEVPSIKGFQIAWRGTRAARRQTSLMLLFLQVMPGGKTLIAKSYTLQFSTGFVAITYGETPPPNATPLLVQYWFLST
ncbi:hypothetical protein DEO72_LG7g2203 [Vigna unguiculata]|uniref:Uncharacterized protein n=1 Tax=Vigna unguiculata TaxID=3917 RepID=A0A4D6MJW9_VIGUN|nr:hypothetical protein DEO72_LG7g2203 [Vigna unguiculata]